MMRARQKCMISFLLALMLVASPAFARDVAFVEPGASGGAASAAPDEAFKIEPKSEIDIGESIVNILRKETLFFVNQTGAPIKVEKVTLSSDSTVTAALVNDDCSKESTVPPQSRCSIEFSVTPTGPGSWGVEMLMTHNGPGRITRARITGKTGGAVADDKKDHGLFLSAKDTKPVEFGDVTAGDGKIVRSALMVNDSPSPITLYSVDVIEADKTLQRLDSGCAADMELKPGESCPVTLVWAPTTRGVVSTDLIIRHSGQAGFVVIPVRGTAKAAEREEGGGGGNGGGGGVARGNGGNENRGNREGLTPGNIAPPPTPNEVAREVTRATGSGGGRSNDIGGGGEGSNLAATGSVHLIGTVGGRAVLLKPDGTTAIVQVGDLVNLGDATPAKVLIVSATMATLQIDGKKKDLMLEAVQELKDKAAASKKSDSSAGGQNPSGGSGKDNVGGGKSMGGGAR